ncbi:hypothetical protein XNC1_4354 [Xenorhabdus nematophila ATCC 19061]|uniref:Mutator family transposase n=1 Tax=Xenorhabdus nematophila (strain ATCC 19061 / DSM 3370 / CCUG 14189 / LMG 1036 / NCIMB 9965 / AN6) TaxID=406817 RepID=D3VEC5_XENNA|nr:hypothetical protein XNC1_4354 [Xenorhabdus nematophila ATCC 19061]CEE90873.1 hypothetical protein XNA1_1740018 [Xenorhabdus nematophila str. Anatoliense]CEF29079.1 hypothetical protein XNW1_1540031 [Xenorhabdus nematophila str. Websteri]CEK25191.1 hypothetical protein XNC2_4204 [Xenorhabdus nematophila AN6/1]CEE94314.1 hypothetical protein XNA1_4580018 [Xenorhabdus nematophila str. Anatoliense]
MAQCADGTQSSWLKGFPEAINTVYPQTRVQLCIVHTIRNNLRYGYLGLSFLNDEARYLDQSLPIECSPNRQTIHDSIN